MVDLEEKIMKEYSVRIIGTGWKIERLPTGFKFLDTIQLDGGSLVFHIFISYL